MAVVLAGWAACEGVGRPVALGLDVTERAKMTPDHLRLLHAAAGDPRQSNPVLTFVDDALRFYMEFHSRYDGFYGAFIHDALAVAAALDPDFDHDRITRRGGRAGRQMDDRRDSHRLAPLMGQARRTWTSRSRRTSTRSSSASSSASEGSPRSVANVAI